MFLDIKKLLSSCEKPEHFDYSEKLAEEDFPGYTVADPVSVSVDVRPEADAIRVEAKFDVTVRTQCARCLDDIEQTFHLLAGDLVREKDFGSDELDIPVDEQGRLDIKEMVYLETVLDVPNVLLCSANCEGLCPVCGKRKPCGCKDEPAVDDRLAVLKQLLS